MGAVTAPVDLPAKAEAEDLAEDVRTRLAELDGLLKVDIRNRPVLTFASLKRNDSYPVFDAGQLGKVLPPPLWEDSAPAPPSGLGKAFGGGGHYQKQLDDARAVYARAVEKHTAAEADRRRQLAGQRAAHDADDAAFTASVAEHNTGIDRT
jgi:restriction system protein